MFGKRKENVRDEELVSLDEKIERLNREKSNLRETIENLTVEKRKLQLTRDIEIRDIKHMVKIKEEKLDIQFEKKSGEFERNLQRASDKEILAVKNKYRDKVEKLLEKGHEDLRGRYSEILERLPNIDVAIKGNL